MSLQYEAILASSALASAHWYASQQRQGKAIESLQKASLFAYDIKDPLVAARLRELCKATSRAWDEIDFTCKHYYFSQD